jgi:hypothetical protein
MYCNPLNLSKCLSPIHRKKDPMAEKDLSSEKFPGQFLPADLGQITENIIA